MSDYSVSVQLIDVQEGTVLDYQVEEVSPGEDHVFVHIETPWNHGQRIRVILSDAPGPLLNWLRGIVKDVEEIDERLRRKRIGLSE